MVKFKKCIGECGLEKEEHLDNFYWRNDSKNFQNKCKICCKLENKNNIKKKKDINYIKPVKHKNIIINGVEYKKCTGECGLEKELSKEHFQWRNDRNVWESKCKICSKIIRDIYCENNSEKLSEYQIKYYEDNREKIINNKKIYYNKNKDVINTKRKKPVRPKKTRDEKLKCRRNLEKQYRKNPRNKIKHSLSNAVLKAFKRRNRKKSSSVKKSLPYTIEQFEKHMEDQFKINGNEWMNWDNHGIYNPITWDDNNKSTWKWQIDHIIPESTFNYINEKDEEFKKCWGLDNLRPYSAKDNCLDGSTRIRHFNK